MVTEAVASIPDHPDVIAAQERAEVPVADLMERAKEQGKLRTDFVTADLQMFFSALGAAQHSMPRDSNAWRRLLGILIDGLKAQAAEPFAEPPLTREEMDRWAAERSARRR